MSGPVPVVPLLPCCECRDEGRSPRDINTGTITYTSTGLIHKCWDDPDEPLPRLVPEDDRRKNQGVSDMAMQMLGDQKLSTADWGLLMGFKSNQMSGFVGYLKQKGAIRIAGRTKRQGRGGRVGYLWERA